MEPKKDPIFDDLLADVRKLIARIKAFREAMAAEVKRNWELDQRREAALRKEEDEEDAN